MTGDALSYFLTAWTDPYLMFLTAAGTFGGIYVGAIPGLSVTMAVSILMSFTFRWEVNEALAMMLGVFMGGVYGGARSAILLNIPGAPSAIATALDGYPLAQRGEAGSAIGMSTIMSAVGGFVGIAVLAVAAPYLSELALQFRPEDYFLIALMGIMLVGTMSTGSLVKGILGGALGITIGCIGLDPMTAVQRFTFDMSLMSSGISPVVAMIGLFGVAEAFRQVANLDSAKVVQQVGKILPSPKLILKYLPLSLKSSAIGAAIGALPGSGGDLAALIAYDVARRTTRNPSRPFGQGAWEGVIAPESANNATVGTAFIPMLTLGIPGDAVTAIFIGALFVHGLNPGPMLMIMSPWIFMYIVGTLALANIFMVLFGLTGVKLFTKFVTIPKGILIPIILVISVVGAYGVSNSMSDVYWVFAFGVLGFVFKTYGLGVGPIVLGIILSRLIEDNWRRMIIAAQGKAGDIIGGFFTSPLTVILSLILILLLLSQTRLFGRVFSLFRRRADG